MELRAEDLQAPAEIQLSENGPIHRMESIHPYDEHHMLARTTEDPALYLPRGRVVEVIEEDN